MNDNTPLPEAPASINFRVDYYGINVQFTFRGHDEDEVMERLRGFYEDYILSEEGFTSPAVYTAHATTDYGGTYQTGEAHEPIMVVESLEFDGYTKGGDAKWKVKGFPFTEFGVVAYPEAFAEGPFTFDPTDAKTIEKSPIKPQGQWKARLQMGTSKKDPNKTVPKKVLGFEAVEEN